MQNIVVRTAKPMLVAAALVALLSNAYPAAAKSAGKPFSSGLLNTGGSGPVVTTECLLVNLGTRPITVNSVTLLVSSSGTTVAASFDSCTTAPLAPGKACSFSAATGVFGGGTAFVAGDPRHLRGNCELTNSSNVAVQTAPMR